MSANNHEDDVSPYIVGADSRARRRLLALAFAKERRTMAAFYHGGIRLSYGVPETTTSLLQLLARASAREWGKRFLTWRDEN